ncbi:HAD family hydrolase [Haloarchaeobius sp. HRN-SO-5]|uniref:HAD family hydrolase n=1 Tax=Haloarchaeobius sp. HRN-SO-5 TaxID=3446118 RepID=UPI003EBC7C57
MSTEYDGVVYDLDGTLVSLDVDWDAVARDVESVYRAASVAPDGRDLWGLLGAARANGIHDEVEAAIASHELDGARSSERLRLADRLESESRPVGVCSLNCEAACRLALSTHGLTDHVGVVVGRDTLSTWKPDPDPLLHATAELGLAPSQVLFVGDSERDERTAERAGTGFEYV